MVNVQRQSKIKHEQNAMALCHQSVSKREGKRMSQASRFKRIFICSAEKTLKKDENFLIKLHGI